jgi:hypothetical protein
MNNLHKIGKVDLSEDELAVLWNAQKPVNKENYPEYRKIHGYLETYSKLSNYWYGYTSWGLYSIKSEWIKEGKPMPDVSQVKF